MRSSHARRRYSAVASGYRKSDREIAERVLERKPQSRGDAVRVLWSTGLCRRIDSPDRVGVMPPGAFDSPGRLAHGGGRPCASHRERRPVTATDGVQRGRDDYSRLPPRAGLSGPEASIPQPELVRVATAESRDLRRLAREVDDRRRLRGARARVDDRVERLSDALLNHRRVVEGLLVAGKQKRR